MKLLHIIYDGFDAENDGGVFDGSFGIFNISGYFVDDSCWFDLFIFGYEQIEKLMC